jgi:hypothetical protein
MQTDSDTLSLKTYVTLGFSIALLAATFDCLDMGKLNSIDFSITSLFILLINTKGVRILLFDEYHFLNN